MRNAMNVFNSLIAQGAVTKGLYEYIETNKIPLDSSDLLRWQWVLSISALDKYVHDIVRAGMIDEFLGRKTPTSKFKTFHIDMNALSNIKESSTPEIEFEKEVVRQHSFLAFQYPDKITDALSYIWDEPHKWNVISGNMSTAIMADNLRTKLKNIVVRRNQIVHEGDCFSTTLPLQQQPILFCDTEDVVQFIKDLVSAIDASIA